VNLPTADDPVTVIEGDALGVLPSLPAGCVSAVVTDPPYGIGLRNHGNFSRDWTITGDESGAAAEAIVRIADSHGWPLCVFGSAYRPYPGRWRNILVWDKGPGVGSGGDPARCWKRTFDLIFVRGNRPLLGNRDGAVLKYWQSGGARSHRHHPAEKPVDLMRYLIRQLVPPEGLVLAPFAGSGTTGVAAALEGRRCLLIEKEPAYAAIARKRVAEAVGKTGLLAGVT